MMHCPKAISRRNFLTLTCGLAASCMLPVGASAVQNGQGPALQRMAALKGFQPDISSLWVPRGEQGQAYASFKRMVEAATDFSWLSKGDRVLLKIALNSGNSYPATTDPWLLSSMVRLLKDKGAGPIYAGDQSGVETVYWAETQKRGSSRACCDSAGLLRVITESGAEPVFFEERGYDAYLDTRPRGSHHWQEPVRVTSMLEEVDHVIYLARVSSHVMGDITSGMKLGVGFLREDSRLAFHRGGGHFYAMYEEINAIPEIASKLRLAVSSGRSVLSTLGPDNGHVSEPDFGLVFASEDLLAHELMAYAWLMWNRDHNTSAFARATTGKITRWRSQINKAFVWKTYRHKEERKTPGLSLFEAGDIYQHPSIINFMQRKGGMPERINWTRINSVPDQSMMQYLHQKLKV